MGEAKHTETLIWVCITVLSVFALAAQLACAVPQPQGQPLPRLHFASTTPAPRGPAGAAVLPGEEESPPLAGRGHPSDGALFVHSIVQVESRGDARCVGQSGERGLMQIMCGTWRETTEKMFREPVSFDRAFEPGLNRRVGTAYLARLRDFLLRRRGCWSGDMRGLLAAAYNAGPGAVERAGFDLEGLSPATRSYVQRVLSLHDYYRSQPRGDAVAFAAGPAPSAAP